MSQPEPFPQTTPPVESTPPTLDTSAPVTRHDGAPTQAAQPSPWEAAGERYEVLRFHARGGMGEVSVAFDRELQREVAFKQIQPRFSADSETKRRFILEAEVTGRLEHPGIVPIYGLGEQEDGRPYYAMRFIQGDSLREAIAAFHEADRPGRDPGQRELALRGLLRRFIDVCNAVAFAHDRGWLHRDLKPANVMLGQFGETLVVDWGLARPLRPQGRTARAEGNVFASSAQLEETHQTSQGAVVGTPLYMSPEQARGDDAALGVASDVYSLGALLFELLTGQGAFAGTVSEVLEAVQAGRVIPARKRNPRVPAALEAVVAKAMALRGEDRYATALELAGEVERWLGDEPVSAYREPLSQRVRRWGRRHRALVTGLAVLLLTTSLALSVGLFLVNEARSEADTQRVAARQAEAATALALERETHEKLRAEAARKLAEAQARAGLNTVKAVVYGIKRRLDQYPGMQELRREILGEAAAGLKNVARVANTSDLIDREQLVIHSDLGDLFRELEKDGVALAQEQYVRGHAIAVRLVEADPKNAQAQRDLSVSHEKLGDVRLQLGDTKAALEAYQQCHAINRRLAEADPNNAQAQRELSVSHEKLGDVRLKLGITKAALDAYQQSLDVRRRLAEADPNNAQAQRDWPSPTTSSATCG